MEFRERHDTNKLKFLKTLSFETHSQLTFKSGKKITEVKQKYTNLKNLISRFVYQDQEQIVQYTQNKSRGRFYARTSSAQTINKIYRGFLCKDTTTDIDIKNCYPVLLKYICENNNIICPSLTYYVDHRDFIFNNYQEEKDVIKEHVLSLIFGGTITTKNEFVSKFRSEIKGIQEKLKNTMEFKKYFEEFPVDKTNKEGSAIFKIIEDVEIQIVQRAIDYLKKNGYEVSVYMYDGVMIHGNHYNNKKLLEELNNETRVNFPGMNIEFVYKEHQEHPVLKELYENFVPGKILDESYEKIKEDFEMFCAKIINKSLFIMESYKNDLVSDVIQLSESKLNVSYKHLSYKKEVNGNMADKQFLSKWLTDDSMRMYKDLGIYPDTATKPQDHYNLWTPFDAEYIKDYEWQEEALGIILNHIKIICGDEDAIYEYFLKWIAYIIQFPTKKTICPVFISKEGAGKGTMFNLFRKMLGDKKVMESTNPSRDVWGDFNGQMMNSYLVNINELGKKQQIDAVGQIKGLITDPELIVNQKGLPQVKITSYHKFIITTNSEDPVYMDDSDRRFFVVRSSDKKIGDLEYFKKLNNLLEDESVIKTCYEYFKNLPQVEEFPFIKKPISEYHENLKELNKPVIIQFLEHIYYLNKNEESKMYNSAELFAEFTAFKYMNGITYDTTSLKLMCSIRNLRFPSITKKRTKTNNITKVEIKKLRSDLKISDN